MKKKRKKKIIMIVLCILGIIFLALTIDFFVVRKIALDRFAGYKAKAKTINSSYGKISYIDDGEGEPFLVCHGITGGYDQGFDVLSGRTDDYRIIAPSRFGYPGTDMPEDATVDMQVEAFVELLDELEPWLEAGLQPRYRRTAKRRRGGNRGWDLLRLHR